MANHLCVSKIKNDSQLSVSFFSFFFFFFCSKFTLIKENRFFLFLAFNSLCYFRQLDLFVAIKCTYIHLILHACIHTYMMAVLSISSVATSFISCPFPLPLKLYVLVGDSSYIHTYIHTYVHTYITACIHTYIDSFIDAYIHTYIHT